MLTIATKEQRGWAPRPLATPSSAPSETLPLSEGGAASVRNSDRVTLTLGLFGQTVSMAKLSEEGMSSLGAGA